MESAHPFSLKKKMSPAAFQALFIALRVMADILVSVAIPYIAYKFRFDIVSPELMNPSQDPYMLLSAIFAGSNLYFFFLFGTYRPVRGRSSIDEIFGVIKVCSVSTVILLAVAFFVTRFFYSRLTVIYSMMFSFLLLGVEREALLLLERNMLKRGHGGKTLLIVGAGPNAQLLASKVLERPQIGFSLVGYLEETAGPMMEGAPLLGDVGELERVIARHGVQEIIVAMKPGAHEDIAGIMDICDRRAVECLVSPDIGQMIVGSHRYDEIAGVPVIRLRGLRMRGPNRFIKRACDIVLTSLILLALFPFFLLISLLIRIDSPGPIFYMQKRLGMDGDEFWMFKFRSMRMEAEGGSAPAWSMTDDPRVTRFGAMIRKLSIDELPQLFNVIRGEMSLVGPRPERAHFVEIFSKEVPRYMERHSVKTGMTGWAQVNGLRGDTSISERVQYDLYYIENWSLWFDFKIMILTAADIVREVYKHAAGKKKPAPGANSKPPADQP